MQSYLISVVIAFIVFSIIGKYYEDEQDSDYDYLWGFFLGTLWPLVVLVIVFITLIEFIVNKIKENNNERI